MTRFLLLLPVLVCFVFLTSLSGQESYVDTALINAYKHLHAHPELSFQEENTAAYLARKMERYGYAVDRNFGGHGIVCEMKNGQGPTVMVRADMDALPVKEETGLPFASTKTTTNMAGKEVPVMHACGHDLHMTVFLGTARYLANHRDQWSGTVRFIGQPAEERGGGAKAMLAEGLYEKYSVPDYAVALHAHASLEAGKVGFCEEYAMANVDMMDIIVYGKGGHGAYPHKTIDPVVLAAEMILDFQTIVSRKISPLDPAVITVGSIHGGTKGNVIPDEVKLELTLRSYTDEVRNQIIEEIQKRAFALAMAAGLPENLYPDIQLRDEFTPAIYNDPALVKRMRQSCEKAIGQDHVVSVDPVMAGEDFARYGRTPEHVPITLFWLGAVDPEKKQSYEAAGKSLPSLHSSKFRPDYEKAIDTGVACMSRIVTDLFSNSSR